MGRPSKLLEATGACCFYQFVYSSNHMTVKEIVHHLSVTRRLIHKLRSDFRAGRLKCEHNPLCVRQCGFTSPLDKALESLGPARDTPSHTGYSSPPSDGDQQLPSTNAALPPTLSSDPSAEG